MLKLYVKSMPCTAVDAYNEANAAYFEATEAQVRVHSAFTHLQKERDELAARVGELTGALESVLDELSNDSSVMGCDSRATADWFVGAAAVLCCSPQPAASLARHDAEVLASLRDNIPAWDCSCDSWLDAQINRIEQEASGQ